MQRRSPLNGSLAAKRGGVGGDVGYPSIWPSLFVELLDLMVCIAAIIIIIIIIVFSSSLIFRHSFGSRWSKDL